MTLRIFFTANEGSPVILSVLIIFSFNAVTTGRIYEAIVGVLKDILQTGRS